MRALLFILAALVLMSGAIVPGLEPRTASAQPALQSGYPTALGDEVQRVPVQSDEWPWSAIGRVNVVAGTSSRRLCTGTLIAPRRVLTAAHCLFDTRTNDWVKPASVHFVVGQTRDQFLGHSLVESFVTSPQFGFKLEDRPRYDFIDPKMIRHDWAILTLRDALPVKPIPIRARAHAAAGGEFALAGYAVHHPYMLSMHKGCDARLQASDPGVIIHRCASAPGESGGPILLLTGADASVIGIHSAHLKQPGSGLGHRMLGQGVAAGQFAAAAAPEQP